MLQPARPAFLFAALACLLPGAAAAAEATSASPHALALQLVLQSQAAQIEAMDRELPREHDTLTRAWSVERAIAPGFIDTRGLLQVTYHVDGVALARWQVDLAAARVTEAPVSMVSLSPTAVSPDTRRP
ncbi:hypothetical protein [Pseudoxanthomonas composti]|uniref:Uncharacterized protein n=1 Tax=Pseudoxanthomonas composti TaxID=2137479 RepID=A0A4Q1JSJ2_9GAMM|nr:hypothetical protein [Pseudoxanthomonas composti]RXR01385.1 hypothetical protein EPA99_15745 [Pseudoxanthomonas composti]